MDPGTIEIEIYHLGGGLLRHTSISMLTGKSSLQSVNHPAALKIEQSHNSSGMSTVPFWSLIVCISPSSSVIQGRIPAYAVFPFNKFRPSTLGKGQMNSVWPEQDRSQLDDRSMGAWWDLSIFPAILINTRLHRPPPRTNASDL